MNWARLIADPAAVLASVAGSTCATDFPELLPFISQALKLAAVQGSGAANARLVRSARIEAEILGALGAFPVSEPLGKVVAIVRRRLEFKGKVHCDRTIRAVLRKRRAEKLGTSDSQVPPTEGRRQYSGVHSSSTNTRGGGS